MKSGQSGSGGVRVPLAVAAILVFVASATSVIGQELLSILDLSATIVNSVAPAEAQEELPGLGHKFELYGTATDAKDPDNPTNDVISTYLDANDPAATYALALRRLPPGIKIAALDNQLNLKYRFTYPRTCLGGSPRMTLFIDANGDGRFNQVPNGPDFAAHGHVNPPLYSACPQDVWRIEDLTDEMLRWDITPCSQGMPPSPILPPASFSCPFPFNTWESLEATVMTAFPFHKVLAGQLTDDTYGQVSGQAHYDLVTIENRTLENDQDTVKGK